MAVGDISAGTVTGESHPAFASVVAYFGKLFNSSSRGGGALAVRWRGKIVIDVWGGFAEKGTSQAWEKDSVAVSFSTSKGLASTVIHRLADRGLIDYDAPVATYWPEFGAAGKQAVTVRQLLSHQAGMQSMAGLVKDPSDLLDHIAMEEKLASRPSDPLPGHPGYHAITYGWLASGLARSVTGLGMAELVRSELSVPLDTGGLNIGLPPEGLRTVAPLIARIPPIRPIPPLFSRASEFYMPRLMKVERMRRSLEAFYVPHFDTLFAGAVPPVLSAEMPAVNGVLSARGLAKLYAPIANNGEVDGKQFLSPSTVRAMSEVQTRAHDAVIGMKMNWRLGYHRAAAKGYRDDLSFGHYGFGGSGGWADPDTGLSFGFVTNDVKLIQAPVGGDPRIFRLSGLLHEVVKNLRHEGG